MERAVMSCFDSEASMYSIIGGEVPAKYRKEFQLPLVQSFPERFATSNSALLAQCSKSLARVSCFLELTKGSLELGVVSWDVHNA